jgi:hypothetical protein
MGKTLFLDQYLQNLGLEIFFSHHYLYQKTFYFILFLFFKFGGPITLWTRGKLMIPCGYSGITDIQDGFFLSWPVQEL